jgi:hypothetical protein
VFEQVSFIGIFALLFVIHFVVGQVTGWLWQRFTYYPIDFEDLKAIRVLWFVFAPLGASLAFINWLHDIIPGKHKSHWKPAGVRTVEEFVE